MADLILNLPSNGRKVACRFRVEWEDNDGLARKRSFKSYRAAELHAVRVETFLLNRAVLEFAQAEGSRPRDALS